MRMPWGMRSPQPGTPGCMRPFLRRKSRSICLFRVHSCACPDRSVISTAPPTLAEYSTQRSKRKHRLENGVCEWSASSKGQIDDATELRSHQELYFIECALCNTTHTIILYIAHM